MRLVTLNKGRLNTAHRFVHLCSVHHKLLESLLQADCWSQMDMNGWLAQNPLPAFEMSYLIIVLAVTLVEAMRDPDDPGLDILKFMERFQASTSIPCDCGSAFSTHETACCSRAVNLTLPVLPNATCRVFVLCHSGRLHWHPPAADI